MSFFFFFSLPLQKIDTEPNVDFVRVYDGNSTSSAVLGNYTGKVTVSPIPSLVSTGNTMYVNFTSDNSTSALYEGFYARVTFIAPVCSGVQVITDDNTILTDGSGLYPYLLNCGFNITAPVGYQILLQFSTFATYNSADYLQVFDGTSTQAPLLGRYFGSSFPPLLRSSLNTMFVTFISDDVFTGDGFWATAKFYPSVCNSTVLVTQSGAVLTDSPFDYSASSSCAWNVTAPIGFTITLTFTTLALADAGDVVSVYNGPSAASSPLLSAVPGPISYSSSSSSSSSSSFSSIVTSSANSMLVTFVSDGAGFAAGFVASVQFNLAFCSGTVQVTAAGTVFTNGPGTAAASCTWNITAPTGFRVALTFTAFSTQTAAGESLTIYNTTNAVASGLMATLSGPTLPPVQRSPSSNMLVRWISNGTSVGEGFAAVVAFEPLGCFGTVQVTANGTAIGEAAGTYFPNMNCSWVISAPGPRFLIRLIFSQIATEANRDLIRIYNSATNALLTTYSGAIAGTTIYNTTLPSILLSFTSDGSVQAAGFDCVVVFEPIQCSASVTSITQSGAVLTDGPLGYVAGMSCVWRITASVGYQILITFSEFNTTTNVDVLRLYDGNSTTAPVLATLSGLLQQPLPSPIRSSLSDMYVTWSAGSSASVTTAGFVATVTFVQVSCNGTRSLSGINNTSIFPGPDTTSRTCLWTYAAPLGFIPVFTLASAVVGGGVVSVSGGNSSLGTNVQVMASTATSTLQVGVPVSSAAAQTLVVSWTGSAGDFTGRFTYVSGLCSSVSTTFVSLSGLTVSSGSVAYVGGMNCSWRFSAPTSSYIQLVFLRFALVSLQDSVSIYNGTAATPSALIATYTRDALPPQPLLIPTNLVTMLFNTAGLSGTSVGATSADGIQTTANFISMICNASTTVTANNSFITDGPG